MTTAEARQILLLHRPGVEESGDPQMAEALAMTRRDPELSRWFEEHCAFQNAMREKFRQMEVPSHLKEEILSRMEPERKIVRPAFWLRPAWLATAAAAAVLILGFGAWWLKPAHPDRFANYESRMVGAVLREYTMDIQTNNLRAVRQHLAAEGAPRDYSIPRGLQKLTLTGGGTLHWRGNPVAMVCYDRGDKQMLFLFVMDRSAVKDAPPEAPETATVLGLSTASWSAGDKTYLLAGSPEPDFLKKYY
jgi:hypothetical protein